MKLLSSSRRLALTGLSPDGELRRLVGRDLSTVPLPEHGLVITKKLAEILEVKPGDAVSIEALEGRRPVRQVTINGLVDELLGLSAYMNIQDVNSMMNEERAASGAFILVDALQAAELYEKLKRLPVIAGVQLRKAAIASFNSTLAQSLGVFTVVLVVFSGGSHLRPFITPAGSHCRNGGVNSRACVSWGLRKKKLPGCLSRSRRYLLARVTRRMALPY